MASDRVWAGRVRGLGLAVVLLLVSIVLQVVGRHRASESALTAMRVAERGGQARELTAHVAGALERVAGGPAAGREAMPPSAFKELATEHAEAVDELVPVLRSAGTSARVAEVVAESREARATVQRLALALAEKGDAAELALLAAEARAQVATLSEVLREGVAAALAALRNELAWGARCQRAGLWCCVAALLVVGVVLVGAGSDVVQAALGPVALEEELRALGHTKQFRSRIALLGGGGAAAGAAPWELTLARVLSERRTHVSFEAVAARGEERVRLWGKRYKWTGRVKALQRLVLPAYGSATWSILCVLHARGINGPVPIAMRPLRRRRMTVGSILVAEWLSDTRSLSVFLGSDFALLGAERRRELLVALARFVNELHAAGVCRLAPRFFYGVSLDGAAGPPKLYLFDLDKAALLRRGPRWVKALLRWHDLRRLARRLGRWCAAEELAAFREEVRRGEARRPPDAAHAR